jgi:hypothetical protein
VEKVELEGRARQNPHWPVLLVIFLCVGFAAVAACLVQAAIIGFSLADLAQPATPTLDLACDSWGCLRACMQRLPHYQPVTVSVTEADLAGRRDGIEIARYRVEDDGLGLVPVGASIVPDYLQPYKEDVAAHRRIWEYFARLFPYRDNAHVSYFVIFTDGAQDGYAARIRSLGGVWMLYIDILDFDNPYDVTDILVHEYGHMLTLNDSQLKAVNWHMLPGGGSEREHLDNYLAQCDTFFTGESCVSSDSYLNEFGRRFWPADVYESWADVYVTRADDEPERQAAVQKFYSLFPDRFVSQYAATNPKEDIAETWTEFVLRPKPAGDSIADRKILFFYEYPELVELRAEIIRGVCAFAATGP